VQGAATTGIVLNGLTFGLVLPSGEGRGDGDSTIRGCRAVLEAAGFPLDEPIVGLGMELMNVTLLSCLFSWHRR